MAAKPTKQPASERIETPATPQREEGDGAISSLGDSSRLSQALAALDEIAARPTSERNPDGVEQAAETMALLAGEHAKRVRAMSGGGEG